jgi:hypothetical protein
MTPYDCETTRDLLPLRIREDLLPHEAARVDLHVSGCADCLADAALVRALAATAAPVPPDLERRVLGAVRTARAPRRVPAGIGMAAALAAALLGGVLLMQRAGPGLAPESAPRSLVLDDGVSPPVSWTMTDDPLLHGSTLQQLSVEQLEVILAELDG